MNKWVSKWIELLEAFVDKKETVYITSLSFGEAWIMRNRMWTWGIVKFKVNPCESAFLEREMFLREFLEQKLLSRRWVEELENDSIKQFPFVLF